MTQNSANTTPLEDDDYCYPNDEYDTYDEEDDDNDILLAAKKGRLKAIQSILEEERCNVNDEDEVGIIFMMTLL